MVHIKPCKYFIVRVAKLDERSKSLTFYFRIYFWLRSQKTVIFILQQNNKYIKKPHPPLLETKESPFQFYYPSKDNTACSSECKVNGTTHFHINLKCISQLISDFMALLLVSASRKKKSAFTVEVWQVISTILTAGYSQLLFCAF